MKTNIITVVMIIFGVAVYNQVFNQSISQDKPVTDCCGELELYESSKSLMVDTISCARWDHASNSLVPYSRTINTYDPEGRIIESESGYYLSTGDFKYMTKYEFSYYPFDSLMTRTDYYWNVNLGGSGAWDNSKFYEYTYDSYNRLSEIEMLYSPIGTTNWQNSTIEYISYGTNNLIDVIITKYWNSNENAWWSYLRYRYIYDQYNNLLEEYTDYSNNQNGIFQNSTRVQYNPGALKYQKEIVWQVYSQSQWVNNKREVHNLNDMGLSEIVLKENWNSMEMMWDTMFRERDIYEYDVHGSVTDYIYQSSYIEWFNISRETYDYDINGNLIQSEEYQWDHNAENWTMNKVCYYKTGSDLSLSVFSEQLADFNFYPNPTNGKLNVTFEKENQGNVRLLLVNSLGQIIQEVEPLQNEVQINLDDYEYGIYFLKLERDGMIQNVKKLIYH